MCFRRSLTKVLCDSRGQSISNSLHLPSDGQQRFICPSPKLSNNSRTRNGDSGVDAVHRERRAGRVLPRVAQEDARNAHAVLRASQARLGPRPGQPALQPLSLRKRGQVLRSDSVSICFNSFQYVRRPATTRHSVRWTSFNRRTIPSSQVTYDVKLNKSVVQHVTPNSNITGLSQRKDCEREVLSCGNPRLLDLSFLLDLLRVRDEKGRF